MSSFPKLKQTISKTAWGANGWIFQDVDNNSSLEEYGCRTCYKVYKSSSQRIRMIREFNSLQSLNVNGVNGIPRVFKYENVIVRNRVLPAIKMELLDGPDLQTYISEKATSGKVQYYPETKTTEAFFPENVVFNVICRQLFETLESVHLKGAHRDIKLENLILTEDDGDLEVSLIDFDFYTPNDQLNYPGSMKMKGTLLYASPEELKNHSRGQPSDVWAVGICLLVILGQMDIINNTKKSKNGSPLPFFFPYGDTTPEAHVQVMISERIKRLKISDSHKSLLSKILNTDPKDRIDAASVTRWLSSSPPTNNSTENIKEDPLTLKQRSP